MATLTSFKPTRREPWDARKAEHLLNRAGFGGTPAEVQSLVDLGFDGAVHRIVQYEAIADPLKQPAWLGQPLDLAGLPERPMRRIQAAPPRPDAAAPAAPEAGAPAGPDPTREQLRRTRQLLMRANRGRIEALRAWWLDRMVHSPRPLEEKMTLFWHGHFATQATKVRIPQMIYAHLDLLRRNATGSFRELVLGVSRDPAMLVYLDNNRNRREHPNENYARELMELFTLGIGHYSEADVKEAARAFTGWSMGVQGERGRRAAGPMLQLRIASGEAKPAFMFRPAWHDADEKQFLGQRGSFDGADVVRILLEQPACAEFICAKLVRAFVDEERPRPELVAGLAELMRRHDYQMKPVLEALFGSREFYADDVIGGQIKSPVQLVVGAVRQLRAEVEPPLALSLALRQMGQLPLDPPNVAGWDGGKNWINTTTLLARYNFSLLLLEGRPLAAGGRRAGGQGMRPGGMGRRLETHVDVMALCRPEDFKSSRRLVDRLADCLLSSPLSTPQRAELVAAAGKPAADDEARIKHLVHLIMSTPNYQVC
jgi:uncharacterized protein (DUF1800 family)